MMKSLFVQLVWIDLKNYLAVTKTRTLLLHLHFMMIHLKIALNLLMNKKPEKIACLEARKYLSWYLRGVPYAAYARERISRVTVRSDVERVISLIRREL